MLHNTIKAPVSADPARMAFHLTSGEAGYVDGTQLFVDNGFPATEATVNRRHLDGADVRYYLTVKDY